MNCITLKLLALLAIVSASVVRGVDVVEPRDSFLSAVAEATPAATYDVPDADTIKMDIETLSSPWTPHKPDEDSDLFDEREQEKEEEEEGTYGTGVPVLRETTFLARQETALRLSDVQRRSLRPV